MDSSQEPKEKKVLGISRSCFYATARPNIHAAKVMLCIWWDQVGVIYYELSKPIETITGERYWTQLMRLSRALREKRAQYEQRHEKVILQHDNARPHVAKPVKTYLGTLKWDVLPYPPYSPDTAPSDYYLFRSMAHGLADQQFLSYEDIEKWLDSWIASKDEHFYRNGIWALSERWAKIVANYGQYFEWFICNHFFTIKLHFHQENSGNLVAHLIVPSVIKVFKSIISVS